MRPPKLLCLAGLVTFFSLVYVYQQTQILRLAYVSQKRLYIYEDLLDKNSVCRYNIGKSASLVEITDSLSESDDFQIPEAYRLVRLTPIEGGSKAAATISNRNSLLSRFFGVKREAEAKTTNP